MGIRRTNGKYKWDGNKRSRTTERRKERGKKEENKKEVGKRKKEEKRSR